MPLQPFLIGNLKGGLFTYYKPWLLPNDAFPILSNAYCWRGNIHKRPGVEIMHDTFVTVTSLPAGPVMGLGTQTLFGLTTQNLIAFNLTQVFKFNTATSAFDNISGATVWTGNNLNFFWTTNFARAFWATNGKDPIAYYFTGTTWNMISPQLNAVPTFLNTAQIILPYKNRLVAINTLESGVSYPYRARWSQIGNPYTTVGTPPPPFVGNDNVWRDDLVGFGGFVDLPSYEQIISAEFNKDTLIIFCPTSTWKLVYTGNNLLPFVFQQINDNKGAECQFSRVSFDKGVVAISRYGIVSADQSNVTRIDEKIIDFMDNVNSSTSGLEQIQGIRDQNRQFAYWTYLDGSTSATSPNMILSYNYQEDSWATHLQAFSVFSKYNAWKSLRWEDMVWPWEQENDAWNSGAVEFGDLTIVAGDVNGNIYTYSGLELTTDLVPPTIVGAPVSISYGFDIWTKRLNPFLEQGKDARLTYVDFYLTSTAEGAFTCDLYTDDDPDTAIQSLTVSTAVATDPSSEAAYVRVYLGSVARFHQLHLYLTPGQISTPGIGDAEFVLQAMVLWMEPMGRPNP